MYLFKKEVFAIKILNKKCVSFIVNPIYICIYFPQPHMCSIP